MTQMDAAEYDSWYETPRGRWIGAREVALVIRALQRQSGESLLDVGAGTGYFTRAVGASNGHADAATVAVDINSAWMQYAQQKSMQSAAMAYAVADARHLPFADAAFDLVMSITALCFIAEERRAIEEMLRVVKRRLVIGLLNRHSLLWWQKGRNGGSGGYAGAHWHTATEVRALFHNLPVKNLKLMTAIHLPSASRCAKVLEATLPATMGTGGFMLVSVEPQQS